MGRLAWWQDPWYGYYPSGSLDPWSGKIMKPPTVWYNFMKILLGYTEKMNERRDELNAWFGVLQIWA